MGLQTLQLLWVRVWTSWKLILKGALISLTLDLTVTWLPPYLGMPELVLIPTPKISGQLAQCDV